ncbi:twin-arginine translocase TatA/TatE family subunit [Chloroflexota bacterium]
MVMPHIGAPELAIILVLIFVIFGVGKLPQVGGAFGKAIRAFRKGQLDEEEAEEEAPKPKKRITKATRRTSKISSGPMPKKSISSPPLNHS